MSIRNMMIGGAGATKPDPPTNVVATVGVTSQTASVAFDAPANNGGSAITSFTVTSNPGGVTASGASSPISVSGLTNGTSYTFTVTATNAAGTSDASSASASVTPIDPPLFTFTNATFTPGGNTGRFGPSLGTAQGGMSGTPAPSNWNTNTSYFNTASGIQLWRVPKTGTYDVNCVGAAGGNNAGGGFGQGGYGGSVTARVTLTKNDVIAIVCGQAGQGGGANAGGGGGSFVYRYSDNAIYCVAGGGGGIGSGTRTTTNNSRVDSFDGNPGSNTSGADGNGQSGGSGGSRGVFGSYDYTAGPGAGFNTATVQARPANPCGYASNVQAGAGVNGGWTGGYGESDCQGTLHGGFGGGGGGSGACCESGGGGGGGYSGGGVGNTCCSSKGGGGSYYYTGTLQSATAGANAGGGTVTISFIS